MSDHPLKNWIPFKLIKIEDTIQCQWLYTAGVPFTRPFFDESIGESLSLKENSGRYKIISSISFMEEQASRIDHLQPSAFIFHISRCGSTMISQLLGINNKNIVLPEVPFFDDLLRMPFTLNQKFRQNHFESACKFYCQVRNGTETHSFIKTDSWHILFYKQLREMYPSTPFFLLYREPGEVLASLKKKPGMQSVPGVIEPAVFGFKEDDIEGMNLEAYSKKVLEKYMQCYIDIIQADSNCFLLNYNEGMMCLVMKISAITSCSFTKEQIAIMEERCTRDAKYPAEKFSVAVADKGVTEDEQLNNLYHSLEILRQAI